MAIPIVERHREGIQRILIERIILLLARGNQGLFLRIDRSTGLVFPEMEQ